MKGLVAAYRGDPRVAVLVEALREGRARVLGAVHGGLAAVLLAAVHAVDPALLRVVLTADPDGLADDLEELGVEAAVLPELDLLEEPDEEADDVGGLGRRRAALERFAAGLPLLGTARSLEQPVPDLEALLADSLEIRPGDAREIHVLAEDLVDQGYHLVPAVEAPGQLAIRGGLLDVYPWAAQEPVRIETFGDEVESLRSFDPFTQESIARRERAQLVMKRDHLTDCSLWDQLGNAPLVVLGDLPLARRLDRPPPVPEIRLARQLERGAADGASVAVERFTGDQHRDFAELERAAAVGTDLCVLARNEEAATDLRAALDDHGIAAEIKVLRLAAGYRDQERNLLVVHDFELAHRRPVRRRRGAPSLGGRALSSFAELKPGDYVVHLNHGIARFKGMANMERDGYFEDYLLLEFAEETRLYVPVSAIELIQKYVGGAGRHPPLSKFGSRSWKRKKARAERSVADLTAELLATQARRLAEGGHACRPDSRAQRRFEAGFPYEETADQLAAVREIKADQEREETMDRLLCGDVGFGKTELAMRAAFKAVENDRQVALLAPTTILTEQHHATFADRFADTAIVVACINRFRSPAERRDILARLRSGGIDVLVGTHALLAEDLAFARLGLLIIDEEQRFGVKHKEKLKRLKAGVDVLTLSATPIPRTLHHGLLGLRDVSVLAEAPAERLAVATRLAPWDRMLIRQACERELERGGQVFVVHDRVRSIDRIARKLERLVPTMRLDVVHGQMAEERIADVMRRFAAGAIDCLVATSIVESGLDIPNANTLVVNNAQNFGLAELHQLRGRIGRFTRQAFCYFLVPHGRRLGETARQRLDAIREYSELGAGFKLAMRDLELRGAGNLLGREQSGHIQAIGYELYCRLLADAVARLQGRRPEPSPARGPAIDFAYDAYVPDDYCEAPALKFDLHKQIDACRRLSDLVGVARSARDRFGRFPPPVARLLRARAVRVRGAELGVDRIELADRQLRFHFCCDVPDLLSGDGIPDFRHVQTGDRLWVGFLRRAPDQDRALELCCSLLGLELPFLEGATAG